MAKTERKPVPPPEWRQFHSHCWGWVPFKWRALTGADYPSNAVIVLEAGYNEYHVCHNKGDYSKPFIPCTSLEEAKELAANPEIETILELRRKPTLLRTGRKNGKG